jgi:enamine deaminase RidA (YjgF/YER057c/UK114 family)
VSYQHGADAERDDQACEVSCEGRRLNRMPGIGDRRGSGGPWEEWYGYSRVVRVGPLAVTAGCTAVVDGVVQAVGDAGEQARIAFRTGLAALAEVGVSPEQVVNTKVSIVDRVDANAVGSVHGEVFGDIRPAATMVVVAGLIDPTMLVEVELTAWAD